MGKKVPETSGFRSQVSSTSGFGGSRCLSSFVITIFGDIFMADPRFMGRVLSDWRSVRFIRVRILFVIGVLWAWFVHPIVSISICFQSILVKTLEPGGSSSESPIPGIANLSSEDGCSLSLDSKQ